MNNAGENKGRRCSNCKNTYPATSEYFNRKGSRGGLQSYCRKCQSKPSTNRAPGGHPSTREVVKELVGKLKRSHAENEGLRKEILSLRRENERLKRNLLTFEELNEVKNFIKGIDKGLNEVIQ